MEHFIPTTREEMDERGWDRPDVILVTGDAYVDHPSFGAAVIGRLLESEGWRVAIIAQPDWRSTKDFERLGRPRLFFGVTSGNLDSLVANYTSRKKPRKRDEYSPGGIPGRRPDRALIVYANRIREAFPGSPIVLGGMEASLRRLAHYDWWENRVRRSILLDARGDILVYGMGETQIREIARRLDSGESLFGIRGTVVAAGEDEAPPDKLDLPSFEETGSDKARFNEAFRVLSLNQNPFSGKTLVQRHGPRLVVHFPPALPLSQDELDRVYALPFARAPHPAYRGDRAIPGFETVRFSIISHRGCCGACTFCSLSMHQGRIIQSRSAESILAEVRKVAGAKDFKGTITDIGGPTANLYSATCPKWLREGGCRSKDCLTPEKCPSLRLGYQECIDLYKEAMKVPGVRHLFIESGIRYDLLCHREATEYLDRLCRFHVSGRMKVAPEHASPRVLRVMNKPAFPIYERFVEKFRESAIRAGKELYLVNYFIAAHPGATLEDEEILSSYLRRRRMMPEQVQDFTPLPLTAAGCMYHTGENPFTGERLYVARSFQERKEHRALLQYGSPKNRPLVAKARRSLSKSIPGRPSPKKKS